MSANRSNFGIPRRDGVADEIFVSGSSTYGSTNSTVLLFSGVPIILGNGITYLSDAIFGTRFQINTPGAYCCTLVYNGDGGSVPQSVCIARSSNVQNIAVGGATSPGNQAQSAVLADDFAITGHRPVTLTGQAYLYAGDIVYPITDGSLQGSGFLFFRITRIS